MAYQLYIFIIIIDHFQYFIKGKNNNDSKRKSKQINQTYIHNMNKPIHKSCYQTQHTWNHPELVWARMYFPSESPQRPVEYENGKQFHLSGVEGSD